MCEHDPLPELRLPPLSDDSAVEILEFLYDVLSIFVSRYSDQISRYYHDRSRHNLIEPHQNRPTDDPIF